MDVIEIPQNTSYSTSDEIIARVKKDYEIQSSWRSLNRYTALELLPRAKRNKNGRDGRECMYPIFVEKSLLTYYFLQKILDYDLTDISYLFEEFNKEVFEGLKSKLNNDVCCYELFNHWVEYTYSALIIKNINETDVHEFEQITHINDIYKNYLTITVQEFCDHLGFSLSKCIDLKDNKNIRNVCIEEINTYNTRNVIHALSKDSVTGKAINVVVSPEDYHKKKNECEELDFHSLITEQELLKLAKQYNVSFQKTKLRYYQRLGILPAAKKVEGDRTGYYAPSVVFDVKIIELLKTSIRIELRRIKELVNNYKISGCIKRVKYKSEMKDINVDNDAHKRYLCSLHISLLYKYCYRYYFDYYAKQKNMNNVNAVEGVVRINRYFEMLLNDNKGIVLHLKSCLEEVDIDKEAFDTAKKWMEKLLKG